MLTSRAFAALTASSVGVFYLTFVISPIHAFSVSQKMKSFQKKKFSAKFPHFHTVGPFKEN